METNEIMEVVDFTYTLQVNGIMIMMLTILYNVQLGRK